MLKITEWPSNERPREKLIQYGSSSLSTAELLAILLRSGSKGITALDLARQLLNRFGSLNELLSADFSEIANASGLGKAKFATLKAVLELNKRYLYEKLEDKGTIPNSRATREYLIQALNGYKREVFACLLLDRQYRVIAFKELFYGSVYHAEISLGEVVKVALQYHACAIIIAHNHPSGNLDPSEADIAVTASLKKALQLVDITLLDHFIIAGNQSMSLFERGLFIF